ncbi:hypothetical protein Val02_44360 [Virgisporangium aliadipatigenens]|uniref:WD40 repeat domain-containing protein n=1 Tax=Virgisporangium aliadipatigenens TaxID=741659 RepID=A0A8J3YPB5_9ACTN|nr:WD40 repeat domain-containing protein [Virgisporangium aliadipatigenens]GIJ47550.1 hypothetical protein Val02_44360 [Virgisporangium aliadipatigenens]
MRPHGEALRNQDGEDVSAIAFSTNGEWLAVADASCTVRLWSTVTGRRGRLFASTPTRIEQLAFSHDGRRLAATWGYGIRVWDVLTGEWLTPEVPPKKRHPGGVGGSHEIRAMAFDQVGRLWAALRPLSADLSMENVMWLADWFGSAPFRVLEHARPGAAFSTYADRVATLDTGCGVLVWNGDDGHGKSSGWGGDNYPDLTELAVAPDGFESAVARMNNGVVLFDVFGAWRLATASEAHALAFGARSRFLAAGCADGTVRVWTLGSEPSEPLDLEPGGRGAPCVAFSPDGRFFAAGGDAHPYLGAFQERDAGTVRLWTVPPPSTVEDHG